MREQGYYAEARHWRLITIHISQSYDQYASVSRRAERILDLDCAIVTLRNRVEGEDLGVVAVCNESILI